MRETAGSWRTRTIWEMLDAALDGQVNAALGQLERLLAAGETPVGLLAQASASLRRLAAATRLVRQAEAAGRRPNLRAALEQAGVKSFVLEKGERDLRRLGAATRLAALPLVDPGRSRSEGRYALPPRLILERLITRLAASEGSPASSRR